jgi:putative proteasome-type protease
MTYCLGILTRHGLVFAADSRTNAGVDYISTYQKLFDFSIPGDRIICICVSGNLSITQTILNEIEHDLKQGEVANIHNISTLFDLAKYVGGKVRQTQAQERPWLEADGIDHHCTLLLGGQIGNADPQLYMIYTQGNFIQATPEKPFLQIGEIKYGKPILDRTIDFNTSLQDAAKCALVSIDSTLKSNISVGPPIDLLVYHRDSLVDSDREILISPKFVSYGKPLSVKLLKPCPKLIGILLPVKRSMKLLVSSTISMQMALVLILRITEANADRVSKLS